MSCYFLAHIRIKDPVEYQKYLDKAASVFKKYDGEYLSVDDGPLLLEGKWDYTRSVLIRFRTAQDFQRWYHSDDYQEIVIHRLNAADCDSILMAGLE